LPAARDLLQLMKPGISLALTYSALVGFLMASGPQVSFGGLLIALLGSFLGVAGAEAMSAYTDRDVDALMARTKHRPVPAGRLSARFALGYGLMLSLAAHGLLLVALGPLPFLFMLSGTVIYVLVYTALLKRRTPLNIVVGSFAGGMPLLVGSSSAGSVPPAVLFAYLLIVIWTPAHIWSLSLHYRDDYRRGGIPMLPAVLAAEAAPRAVGLASLALFSASMLGAVAGLGSAYYAGLLPLNAALLALSLPFLRGKGDRALPLFRFTNTYLLLSLGLMALDSVLFRAL